MSRSDAIRRAKLLGVLVIAALAVGCGSYSSNPNRVLMSMTISPSMADARTFPMGQVQFTATGTFSQPPSPAPVPFGVYGGNWSSSNTNMAMINQQGMAQCVIGASGNVTITATANSNSAMGMQVMATAQLTCP